MSLTVKAGTAPGAIRSPRRPRSFGKALEALPRCATIVGSGVVVSTRGGLSTSAEDTHDSPSMYLSVVGSVAEMAPAR